jgi:phosphatidylinositol-3-phosphatase
MKKLLLTLLLLGLVFTVQAYDKIFICILENEGYEHLLDDRYDYDPSTGNFYAPYIRTILTTYAESFTGAHGLTHPSLSNYLGLFSGTFTFNGTAIHKNGCACVDQCGYDICKSLIGPFSAPNIYSTLKGAGITAHGWYEYLNNSKPFQCKSKTYYVQRHNPFAFFDDVRQDENCTNVTNGAWESFDTSNPPDPALLPNGLHIITPGDNHNMHDGTDIVTRIGRSDTWLQNNIDQYVQYARNNNALFILTQDEQEKKNVPPDIGGDPNHIILLVIGPGATPGTTQGQHVNHYNTLSTLTANFGVNPLNSAAPLNMQ